MPVRVVVADGCAFTRQGLRMAFADSDIVVVGEAADAAEAVNVVRTSEPDVVLFDADLPPSGGLAVISDIIHAAANQPKVIVLAMHGTVDDVVVAVRSGATGFLPKEVSPADMLRVAEVVAADGAIVSARLLADLLELVVRYVPGPAQSPVPGIGRLSARERDVLMLLAGGCSTAEIADLLVVAEATVKSHISHAVIKLGCRDRVQAVGVAYETGLVRPTVRPDVPKPRPVAGPYPPTPGHTGHIPGTT